MPKVLVVDDSLSVRKVVQRALESRRIDVLSAASGAEAIEQIGREAPDLVVCDVIMPDMDGYQICEFVKKHPSLGRTPVLLISGIVNSTVLTRAAQAGSDEVMRKPFAADELLGRIESLLAGPGRAGVPGARAPIRASSTVGRAGPAPEPARAAKVAVSEVADPALSLPGGDLKTALSSLAGLPGVSLAALVDREGSLIEAAGDLLPEAELAGAMASCLVESTDGVGQALAQGRLQGLILEYDRGVVLLHSLGEMAMLAIVLDDPAVLGKVRYYVKKGLSDLLRAL